MVKILIVDDDFDLRELLVTTLENEFYDTHAVSSAKQALEYLKISSCDIILLDIMMKNMNGVKMLQQLRKTSNIPVIMLTAKDSDLDKVLSLKLGADDYLTKPFSMNELLARIEAILRRTTYYAMSHQSIIKFSNFTMDLDKRKCCVGDTSIILQAKDFDILYYLAENNGKVLTKKQIYEKVWKEEYLFDTDTIMTHISKIRKIILKNTGKNFIKTIKGVGYRFEIDS